MRSDEEKILAELLASRDAQPHDAQVLAAVDSDEREQTLAATRNIKAQLNDLPDVDFDAQIWRQHVPDTRAVGGTRSSWLRFPLATAASVFLLSALGMFFLFSDNGTTPATDAFLVTGPQVNTQGMALANLMTRSRDLEQRLGGMSGWVNAATADAQGTEDGRIATSPAERVLLYRLADVDGQIGRLYESDDIDQIARLELWQQRVDLLESLVVMRGARQGVRSIYMNNGRSL